MNNLHLATLGLVVAHFALPAQAAYVLNISQSGADVVANGSGSLNVNALSAGGAEISIGPFLWAGAATAYVGTGLTNEFLGAVGPANFGGGFFAPGGAGFGVPVGIGGGNAILVPIGTDNGAQLGASGGTWANATLASLGLTPGTYVWSWGQGDDFDTFTINIPGGPQPGVPEPATWLYLIAGFGVAGATMRARRQRRARLIVPA